MMIQGRDAVDDVRILTLRSMLKLEVKGLRRRGRSAYSIVKAEFGFKGSREQVLEQLNKYIHENILPEVES